MDVDLLKYKIKKSGLSIDEFCKKVGITKQMFYGRCRGRMEFRLSEIKKIMEVLDLDSPMPIFFAEKVASE